MDFKKRAEEVCMKVFGFVSIKGNEDLRSAIESALREAYNEAVEASAKKAAEAYCDELECHAAQHIHHAIRRLRKE